jgi:hypothetical protein
MTGTIKKVDYFAMDVPDKPGEGARILGALAGSGINLLAYSGFPRGRRSQLDFIPENTAAFKTAAKGAKLKLRAKKAGFLVQGEDRPGAVADIMKQLADAKINVTALTAVSSGMGQYGAILWVKPRDVKKAAKSLGVS